MNRQLRSLLLTATVLIGTLAFAQPVPPFVVTVTGFVTGCAAGSSVNILAVQGTVPSVDIDVPVSSECSYSIDLMMESYNGWFQISTLCNGAVVTGIGTYQISLTDSAYINVTLNCGGTIIDCLNVPGGSALPGTACDDGDPNTFNDMWSASCMCVGTDTTYYDCLQVLNGPNVPGALCDDNDPNTQYDAWSANCECMGVPIQPCQACYNATQGMSGNGAVPFTALLSNCSNGGIPPYTFEWSFDGGLTFEPAPADTAFVFDEGNNIVCLLMTSADGCTSIMCDTLVFDANGTLSPGAGNLPCEAGFFVMQAYQWVDSAGSGNGGGGDPIPNELWIWNLSHGGTGNFQFTWDFGDGTTSTQAYPTHTYSSGSAYLMCLTIADNAGCTDTYCDSVSVDGDGLIDGLLAPGNRSTFTVNVMNPLATGVQEKPAFADLNTWPNPVDNVLNIALTSELKGNVQVSISDLSGRVVSTENRSISNGLNRMEVPVTDLNAGMYMVQLSNGKASISSRFVKLR